MAAKDGTDITAVYKVNLHCQQCARDIKKPLMRMQGVRSVDVDFQKSEIKVKGVIDVIEFHKKVEKLSKKKVQLIPPQLNIKIAEKKVEETKATVHKTSIKVNMHCRKCEADLQNMLLRHKGIYSVKTDLKTQTLIVEGIMESDKVIAYIRKKVQKHAEIVTSKPEKKEEQREEKSLKSAEIVELKAIPYFVDHYVYAPQLFSDENPNACIII
ncbi:heavy metal-associated isoprenylated plant protein 4 [Mercurialis annua]|uniref:heavy metal-associated isoprenylated plant protein 4 n=1 Tax=Mercurialis annua TaxID=3986 RepID=UPI00215EE9C9|nr:heavy metal-associated isoprenylated plant protein 4 [Mercurialis annua]